MRLDGADRLFGRFCIEVTDDDIGPFASQAGTNTLADSPSTARDNGYFVDQSHGLPFLQVRLRIFDIQLAADDQRYRLVYVRRLYIEDRLPAG